MRTYIRALGMGVVAVAIGTGEQASQAQSSVPPANATTCGPVFHYGDAEANNARSLVEACARHCRELLDPLPKRDDPMFDMCEDARLHPDPHRAQWYKV